MSEAMIIRRGGSSSGGEGFDPNGAVLKVITSTNCTILVTGTGYSKTHQQTDGFPRSSDANVTEHFFSIPTSAFGTITVTATNTYGDNTKTIIIDTINQLYEVLCSGINIILNSTFGLQEGYSTSSITEGTSATYSARNNCIEATMFNGGSWKITPDVPVYPYRTAEINISVTNRAKLFFYCDIIDSDNNTIASKNFTSTVTKTIDLSSAYYPSATIIFRCSGSSSSFLPGQIAINSIILS